jgi:hypothetical protein
VGVKITKEFLQIFITILKTTMPAKKSKSSSTNKWTAYVKKNRSKIKKALDGKKTKETRAKAFGKVMKDLGKSYRKSKKK